MNESLKSLIIKRQKAFCAYGPDSVQFKYFCNLVNGQRKICRGKYYESKIQHLKGENPKSWWDETKRLCSLKTSDSDLASQINIEGFSELPFKEQANASMPLSSNHSRSISYLQLLLNGFLSRPLGRDLQGYRTARAKSTGSP